MVALSGLLLALGASLAVAPGAAAASDISTVANALEKGPVYVDPAASGQLSAADADKLAQQIEDAGKPVFLAVLPEDFPVTPDDFRNLRTAVGDPGVYAVQHGDTFRVRADPSVLSSQATQNLESLGSSAGLDAFVDAAVRDARGSAPASWGGAADDGVSAGALIGLGAVAVAGGAGAYALVRRNKRKKAEEQRAALDKLRVVVDEDITAFGEELERLDFHPGEQGATDAMREDYERALDSYEQAKSIMASAQRPEDVTGVTQALEDGRFALAVLAARREGRELPERRLPCFFDPRHGPSVADADWAPPGAPVRAVPVCAADKARIDDGEDPAVRTVDTDQGRRPYYEAGPVYGPWAGGYFAGGILPGLLVGTMLGSMMASPAYAYSDPSAGGWGGDGSGSDFGSDDFGGGFGDGGFGGGDFGGGGGGDFGGGF
ncbi:hypothetical protein SAMN05421806_102197 [Streptomyces indicus]|uniref:TLP18.3, Psb32 and MOLO-1 founding protein of phosphatase n=2 Tax=Streptomyces indicus TaxID=417292 RepID=A0A1G8W314_9ACTN|nr:hypothetical protein SAMN05421806_102197 [Streptomyces indicus]